MTFTEATMIILDETLANRNTVIDENWYDVAKKNHKQTSHLRKTNERRRRFNR